MAIPILHNWKGYFRESKGEGLGSSYERVILNSQLERICAWFRVQSILEAPVFGFTGLSGINSLYMGQKGRRVAILDHDVERLDLIRAIWDGVKQPLDAQYVADYGRLPYPDDGFHFSWNFSALWFVQDLGSFLRELTRVTSKVIMLCVPNRSGVGYIIQKRFQKDTVKEYLREANILPENFCGQMQALQWKLVEANFIDCPPWPDTGMSKEDFLSKLGLQGLLKPRKQEKRGLSIMDFYLGKDRNFVYKMKKYDWLEKNAPSMMKRFCAHHRYFIFVPD